MRVPGSMIKIPYASQDIQTDDITAVTRALKASYLTQGPRVDEFEKVLAEFCGAKYAVAVNSGTSALHIACMAAGIGKNDQVIVPPLSFVATANCVLYCGGKPVFADVDADSLQISPVEIERKITRKTKAVIPVDYAGYPADLAAVRRIARKNKLVVIEDASHALGAQYQRSSTGSGRYADMTVFSFHAVKNITTGEGGAVVTNSKKFYERLLRLRTHGITRDQQLMSCHEGPWYYEMLELGFNYRITDFQCALGVSQLRKIKQFLAKRGNIVARYDKAFSEFPQVQLLQEKAGDRSAHHIYPVRFRKECFRVSRGKIFEEFLAAGVLVNVHYIPIYWQPYYQKLGYRKGLCPVAEKSYEELITLPLYPALTNSQVGRVVEVARNIIGKYGI